MGLPRPATPTFDYPDVTINLDLLSNVLYLWNGKPGTLNTTEQYTTGIDAGMWVESVIPAVQSAMVPSMIERGPVPIYASGNTYASNSINLTSDWVDRNTPLSQVYVSVECPQEALFDLLAAPLVLYTLSDLTPLLSLSLNESLVLLANYSFGEYPVNNSDGSLIGWNATARGTESPLFSEIGWFAFNCAKRQWYSTPWYLHFFHIFPRFTTVSNYFLYPASSSYKAYLTGVIFTSLPFIFLAIVVLLFAPSISCARRFRDLCLLCGKKGKNNTQPVPDNPSSMLSAAFDSPEQLRSKRYSRRMCCSSVLCTCPWNRRSKHNPSTTDTTSQLGASGNMTLETISGATQTRKQRREAQRLRKQILTKRQELDWTLKPSGVKVRLVLMFLTVLSLAQIPVGFYLAGAFGSSFQQTINAINQASDLFTQAHDDTGVILDSLNAIIKNCTAAAISEQVLTILNEEQTAVVALNNFSTPSNVVLSSVAYLANLDVYRKLVWVTLNCILSLVSIACLWSLLLTYCTFKCGDEEVVCKRASYHLGRGIRPLIIIVSCLTWVVTGVLVILITLGADMCANPSVLQVNTSVATISSSGQEQIGAQIYSYRQEYTLDNPRLESPTQTTSINVGGFLTGCIFTNTLFNPYTNLVNKANIDHFNVLSSGGTPFEQCAGIEYTLYSKVGLYNKTFQSMNCENFGTTYGLNVREFCVGPDGLTGLFIFFMCLLVFNVITLFIVSSSRDIMPNLYRVLLSKELHKEIRTKQSELRETLAASQFTLDNDDEEKQVVDKEKNT
mmetsp:Transcript_11281/g.18425  ORF Transcript_11281/g.18425 Transcript_11281/m.18425 type:complete len:786 (+) Transcript_11281:35-2392(+)